MAVAPAGATPTVAPTAATAPAAGTDAAAANPTTDAVDANTQAAINSAVEGMVQQMMLRNQSSMMQVFSSFKWQSPIEK